MGEADAAREAWQQAFVIMDDLGHPQADEVGAKLQGIKGSAGPGGDGQSG